MSGRHRHRDLLRRQAAGVRCGLDGRERSMGRGAVQDVTLRSARARAAEQRQLAARGDTAVRRSPSGVALMSRDRRGGAAKTYFDSLPVPSCRSATAAAAPRSTSIAAPRRRASGSQPVPATRSPFPERDDVTYLANTAISRTTISLATPSGSVFLKMTDTRRGWPRSDR